MKFKKPKQYSLREALKSAEDKRMMKRFFAFMFLISWAIIFWTFYLFGVQILNLHGLNDPRYKATTTLITPLRGNIYDRNRELLVRTVRFYQIDYDRSMLNSFRENDRNKLPEDYRNIANIISANSHLSRQAVLNRLSSPTGQSSIYINDRIKESDIVAIERELKKKNYQSGLRKKYSMQQRVYPKGNIGSRFIGNAIYTSTQEPLSELSQLQGVNGIEEIYDRDLRGVYGWDKMFFDGRRNPIKIPNIGRQAVKNGNSLILTIDYRIQDIVEKNLREGLTLFGAKNSVGIVMNPKTGEILAMSSITSSDQDRSTSEIRVSLNLATTYMFEPGSTLKPFTMLAALEKRLVKTNEIFDCRKYTTEHGRTISDAKEFHDLSARDVIIKSSNVGTVKIADRIGSRSLYDTMISFGFGNRTGSDLYGESAGLLRKLRDWQGYSLHSISFGQEISVTPLQLITAYGALANEGRLMRPYIVSRVIDENHRLIRENSPQRIRTLSNKAALDTLKTIMQDVVEYGTGTATKLSYINIAGKTGTAQKQAAGQVGYSNKYIANFVGFYPAEDPRLVCLVLYDEPSYRYRHASTSATVTFRKITEQILALPDYNIVPKIRLQEQQFVTMPNVTGMRLSRAQNILERNNIKYQIEGVTDPDNIVIINQLPKQGVQIDQEQIVIIVAENPSRMAEEEPAEQVMPSLIGLTLRQAVAEAKKFNLHLVVEGMGVVSYQSIPAGRSIDVGATCRIKANL
ncbi:MAG: PASTA domain-containing protein [Candidatus Cloacimonetes bacterium]|nr:PASTA domain-containing protein [Candidatus Cloacimonadota bacterium]